MELFDLLTKEDRDRVKRYCITVGYFIGLLTLLGFLVGMRFLEEDVFKNYFNPARHIIVEQDPDTGEIYVWKDALGNVYSPDNPDVKLFPYGVMILLLVLILASINCYNLFKQQYVISLYLRRQASESFGERKEPGTWRRNSNRRQHHLPATLPNVR